jgi:hypothetical protein
MTRTSPKATVKEESSGYVALTPGQKMLVARWLESIDLDEPGALETILQTRGVRLEHVAGKLRPVGLADPKSGVQVVTTTGATPVYFKVGSYAFGEPTRTTPHRLQSEASDFGATASELLRAWYPDGFADLERFLEKHFPGLRPPLRPFYAARDGSKTALSETAEDAIAQVLRKDHDCTVELVRIDAVDRGAAAERLQSDLPWRRVAVTKDGLVAEPAWHGQSPTLEERSAFEEVSRRERAARLRQLEADLRSYEAQRRAELGL